MKCIDNSITLKNSSKDRNTNIEILRFILITFICFWHIIIHGYNFKQIGLESLNYQADITILTFFCSLFSPAVNCFMFISGWYGIKFSLRKLAYLYFIGICCFVCSLTIRYIWFDKIYYREIITHIFPIASGRWWFLTDYIQVFIISPFIELGFKKLTDDLIKAIICIMSFIEIASCINLVPSYGSSFWGLLYIYILARYFRLRNIDFTVPKLIIAYFASLAIIWLTCLYFAIQEGGRAQYAFSILSYNNPFIIIMAISIFLLCRKIHPTHSRIVNTLLSNVLVIYLITEGIDSVLYRYQARLISEEGLYGILGGFLIILFCLIIGLLIRMLFNKIIKKWML